MKNKTEEENTIKTTLTKIMYTEISSERPTSQPVTDVAQLTTEQLLDNAQVVPNITTSINTETTLTNAQSTQPSSLHLQHHNQLPMSRNSQQNNYSTTHKSCPTSPPPSTLRLHSPMLNLHNSHLDFELPTEFSLI
ncbi:unnamed protein product [Schistosoma margrebowiei]|uniref:Uncharacterized protein n=1 Tax=Schistosoma margrebowiei TaxID=48269 RepID=A0A183N714_9TREM|nr:unnamed protein product [Schistosoma margrebowiei]